MKNNQYEFWMIYISLLQSNIFNILLQLHSVLRIQGIKKKAKKVMNCVLHKLIYLVEYIKKLNITITNINYFRQVLKKFEIERVNKILIIAQKYYNDLLNIEKICYYDALISMFFFSKPTVQFEWKFLNLGLIYQYKKKITHYLPLCLSAQKALLKLYMLFSLSESIKNQISIGKLSRKQFEKTLFNWFACKSNTIIFLNATDLNNQYLIPISIKFENYAIIK